MNEVLKQFYDKQMYSNWYYVIKVAQKIIAKPQVRL